MTSIEMYKEHILDLYKYPHNFGVLEKPTHKFHEFNPLCGDDITLFLIVKNNKIENVSFTGKGCAISMASSSLLTDFIKGKSLSEVKQISSQDLIDMLHIPISHVRLKCALLPLDALNKSIKNKP